MYSGVGDSALVWVVGEVECDRVLFAEIASTTWSCCLGITTGVALQADDALL